MRATLEVPNVGAEPPVVLSAVQPARLGAAQDRTTFRILLAISFCHLLNDMIQSLIPAMYPVLKSNFALDFGQVGLITLAFQGTASLLQPLVGLYADRRPLPYSLAVGMGSTLIGLVLLSFAWSFAIVVLSVALVGVGSAVFHPESSRVARMASGGRHGLAQSIFQVGGNAGASLGPLCAAFIVVPHGQASVRWFSAAALLAIVILANVGTWYRHHRAATALEVGRATAAAGLPRRSVTVSLAILAALMFSKFVYVASMSSYFTFYLMDRFHVTTQQAQVHLFVYLGAVAAGTIIGGPIGDRFGRKVVIWFSILGVFPFTVLMPYADLFWTGILSVIIGLILSSAFSAIIVYAQELVPGNVGAIAGLFFGFAFGMGGLGAAGLGELADHTSIQFVYKVCSFLPLLGLLTIFCRIWSRVATRAEPPATSSRTDRKRRCERLGVALGSGDDPRRSDRPRSCGGFGKAQHPGPGPVSKISSIACSAPTRGRPRLFGGYRSVRVRVEPEHRLQPRRGRPLVIFIVAVRLAVVRHGGVVQVDLPVVDRANMNARQHLAGVERHGHFVHPGSSTLAWM